MPFDGQAIKGDWGRKRLQGAGRPPETLQSDCYPYQGNNQWGTKCTGRQGKADNRIFRLEGWGVVSPGIS